MRRLQAAPNLAIATLWADWLSGGGIAASVQRANAQAIAGQIPPDQCLPEVWIEDDDRVDAARALLAGLTAAPARDWVCPHCRERVEGPFEECWNCGAAMPR